MNRSLLLVSVLPLIVSWQTALAGATLPSAHRYTNSLGMSFVRLDSGSFMMGQENGGDFDERPVHKVTITRPFYMAATEVSNDQFEQFDRSHKEMRGRQGVSKESNEAVLFVNWYEAVRFCDWLSKRDGLPYRLPTEAEWEYACRAGTTTKYSTGDDLPQSYLKNQQNAAFPKPVDLTVSSTPANSWGLFDMHGNVEEWCYDWYGPYVAAGQQDPVGRVDGDFRVTRGGSHNTDVNYLRSANRQGTLPDDKHWLIGFRVVIGEPPRTKPLPKPDPQLWGKNVSQKAHAWKDGPDPAKPYFRGPTQYVLIPSGSSGPLWSRHNHQPAITACPNGDLLAVWYTTTSEKGRNLAVAASRLRPGSREWEPAAPFWDAPDRNDHGSSVLWDRKRNQLYHFNGLSASGTWENLALLMRTSTDNGVTWSKATIINPNHGLRNQVIQGSFITKEGYIIVPCDAVPGGAGGSAIHISKDAGRTWTDPGANRPAPKFQEGESGAWIAGIHTGVRQLADGSLLAFGRGNTINGGMPKSISTDMGVNWTYSASDLPSIGGGQRCVLLRLQEGPLFLAAFADGKMSVTDAAGKPRPVQGLYCAVSLDQGKTWPVRKVVSDGRPEHEAETLDGQKFNMSATSGEPKGYLAGTQSPDGVIHLISSQNHYAFNLAWIRIPLVGEN